MKTFENCLLSLRYKYLRRWTKKTKFEGQPDFEEDWNNPHYQINNGNLYAGHSYCSPDCVSVQNDGLHLSVKPTDELRTKWDTTQQCYWKIGWVEYKTQIKEHYGTWVWKVKVPKDSWVALWLLRYPHSPMKMRHECKISKVDGKNIYLSEQPSKYIRINWWIFDNNQKYLGRIESYDKTKNVVTLKEDIQYNGNSIYIGSDHIIPEVDVFEAMDSGKKISHTVHYGYTPEKYKLYEVNTIPDKIDFHHEYEFAVRISPNKYEFFTDGYLTGVVRRGLSTEPTYAILNNAVHKGNFTTQPNDFIIKSFKYYK